MRHYLLILLTTLFAVTAKGQLNTYPDTFSNVLGYKYVTVKTDYLCSNPAMKNKTTAKYLFDNLGNTIEFLTICENKVCGRHIYTYSNNQLVSHKNFNTWTPYQNNISESKWDSTTLSNEITFQYNGNRLISYSEYVPELQSVSFQISFTYNSKGKVLNENSKSYYDSITEKLETVHYAISDRKEYVYNDTATKIKYYQNNVLESTEEILASKSGQILTRTLKSATGKILNRNSYKYNDKMQLVQINTTDTGYDGFGNPLDSVGYEKTLLKYDDTGKLISKEGFNKGRLCNVEKYIYSK